MGQSVTDNDCYRCSSSSNKATKPLDNSLWVSHTRCGLKYSQYHAVNCLSTKMEVREYLTCCYDVINWNIAISTDWSCSDWENAIKLIHLTRVVELGFPVYFTLLIDLKIVHIESALEVYCQTWLGKMWNTQWES